MQTTRSYPSIHHSVAGLLSLGGVLYALFALDISWLSSWNPWTISILTAGILNVILCVILVSKYKPEETDVIYNSIITSSFLVCFFCVLAGLHFTGYPKGSFFYILILALAITEVNFIFDRRFVIGCYTIAFIGLIYGMAYAGVEFPSGYRSVFGFSLLVAWKTINQVFYRKFVVDKEKRIKHETFHSTVNTLQNELNNTSHVIMGFSEMMKDNQNQAKKEEYLIKINNGLDKMSTQIKKIRELEEVVVDDNYAEKAFIRID